MEFVLYLLLFVSQFFWAGFVILKLWAWFLVPFGLPAISLAQAVGLDALFAAFKGAGFRSSDAPKESWESVRVEASARILANDLWLLVSLVVGYIARLARSTTIR